MSPILESAAFPAYVCSAAFTVIKLVVLAFATIAFRSLMFAIGALALVGMSVGCWFELAG
jgi:hypothetical protein